jgi:hypothetical protein
VTAIRQASAARVFARATTAWQPYATQNVLILAQNGAGKTTLARRILALRPQAQVVVFLPKVQPDPSWVAGRHPPRPVPRLADRFGGHQDGGGPAGRWYLRPALPDRAETTRIMSEDIELLKTEGQAIVVIDDAHTLASVYGLHKGLGELASNGRSAGLSVITCSYTTKWLPGEGQYHTRFLGHPGSIGAAGEFARALPATGGRIIGELAATPRHGWVYADDAAPAIPAPARFTMTAGL